MMSSPWNAEVYDQHARFVSKYGEPLLDWLAPKKGEKILDIGCGDGYLAEKIQSTGAEVVGIDMSESFIEAAQARGIQAMLMNAHEIDFQGAFDAVFSNAALHWMKENPQDLLSRIYRALKPQGRFIGEMGGMGNVAAIRVALHAICHHHEVNPEEVDPWWFPSQEVFQTLLEEAGFLVEDLALCNRPTPLPGDISNWLSMMASDFFAAMSPEQTEEAMRQTKTLLKPILCDENGHWVADYVRLRFKAKRLDG